MSSRSSSHQGKKHNLNHLQKVNQSLFISNHPSYNPLCDDHNYMNLCSPDAPQTIFKRAPWLNLLLVVSQRLTFDWALTIIFLASSFRLSNDKFRLSSVKLSLWTFKCWFSVFMSAVHKCINYQEMEKWKTLRKRMKIIFNLIFSRLQQFKKFKQ